MDSRINEIEQLATELKDYYKYREYDKYNINRLNYEYRLGRLKSLLYWLSEEK